MTSCLTSSGGTDAGSRGIEEAKPAFLPEEFTCVKQEPHCYPVPLPEVSEISLTQ